MRRVPGHEFTGVVHSLGKDITHRLAAPAAQGGRSRRVPVLQPVQSLLLVHPRRASRVPASPAPQQAVHARRVPVLRRRLRRLLLPAAGPLRLQGARRAPRRGDPARELRALPGAATASSTANMKFGDIVVIQGAGGLGIYAAAVAAERGRLEGHLDRRPARRASSWRKQCGATDVIDLNEFPTPEARVQRSRSSPTGAAPTSSSRSSASRPPRSRAWTWCASTASTSTSATSSRRR